MSAEPAVHLDCPRPRKRVYADHDEAWAHITTDFPDDNRIAPYVCQCGSIHIGHKRRPGEEEP